MIEVRLLGRFEIVKDGLIIEITSRPAQHLLAFLSVFSMQNHRREYIAGVLWPNSDETNARKYLSQALWRLRREIGDQYFQTDKYSVGLNNDADIDIDVVRFENSNTHTINSLTSSLTAYAGRLLPDFYEEWIQSEATRLNSLFERNSNTLLDLLEKDGKWQDILHWAGNLLEHGDASEPVFRSMMTAHAALGNRVSAVSVYRRCVEILQEDLGIGPSSETVNLYEQILAGEMFHKDAQEVESKGAPFILPSNPYRGLFSFRPEHAHLFFGRERLTDKLVEMIQSKPFVAVVGPSGSGKSSVVFAGLMAAMQTDKAWLQISVRPGPRPFLNLAAALIPFLKPENDEVEQLIESRKLEDAFLKKEVMLLDVVEKILRIHNDNQRMLIVIDQFEEIFSLVQDLDIQRKFLDMILNTVHQQTERRLEASIVLTVRADFYGQLLIYRPMADLLQDADVKLGPMSPDELFRAISAPAKLQNVQFESGLVARILDDVRDAPGSLPLLEFSLAMLWNNLTDGKISHAAYEAVGCVKGALSAYADNVYEKLGAEQKANCRRIFVQMIRPGKGTEDTRRLATRAEIGEDKWELVQHMATQRLVITDSDEDGNETVEIAHEALIRNWGRLRGWMENARAFRGWQERLRMALRQWEINDNTESALLRGVPLAEAEQWLKDRGEELSSDEVDYIQQGLTVQRLRKEEIARMQNARARMQRAINVGLLAGLIVTIVLTILVVWQWRLAGRAQLAAEAERDRADVQAQVAMERWSIQLSANVLNIYEEDLDLGMLLSLESLGIADTFEGRSTLLATLGFNPSLLTEFLGDSVVTSLAFHPGGDVLAVGYENGEVILWNVDTGQEIRRLVGAETAVLSLTYNPDGSYLAAGGRGNSDADIYLWSLRDGDPRLITLEGHTDDILSLAFAPDGSLLASGSQDAAILLWEPESGQQLISIETNGWVQALAFHPDGGVLAAGSCADVQSSGLCSQGKIELWNTQDGRRVGLPRFGHSSAVTQLVFQADGSALISAGKFDEVIQVHPLKPNRDGFELDVSKTIQTRSESGSISVQISDSGKTLIGWGDGGVLFVENGAINRLAGHNSAISAIVFSRDGRLVASGSEDYSVLIWGMDGDQPLGDNLSDTYRDFLGARWVGWGKADPWVVLFNKDQEVLLLDIMDAVGAGVTVKGHDASFVSDRLSKDKSFYTILADDGDLRMWNTETGQQIGPALMNRASEIRILCSDANFGVTTMNFSGNSRFFASADVNGNVSILDLDSGQLLNQEFPGHEGGTWGVALSHAGDYLVTSSGDGELIIRDTETGDILKKHQALHSGGIPIIAITPEDDLIITGSRDKIVLLNGEIGEEGFAEPFGPPIERCMGFLDETFRYYGAFNNDFSLQFWDLKTMQRNSELTEERVVGRLSDAYLDPGGKVFATVAPDHDITVWDLSKGEQLLPPLRGHEIEIRHLEFSADISRLASIDVNHRLILWNLETGTMIGEPFANVGLRVDNFAFSRDGKLLVADLGSGIYLWDVAAERMIGSLLDSHRGIILAFAFSSDDELLTTFSRDAIYRWNLGLDAWRDSACYRVNRNLTQAEWRQYFGDVPYEETCPGITSIE